jgi:hypothetical protein
VVLPEGVELSTSPLPNYRSHTSVELSAVLNSGGSGYDYSAGSVIFADGIVRTQQQLAALADTASPTNTRLYCTPGAGVFDSKGYVPTSRATAGLIPSSTMPAYGALEINGNAGYFNASTVIWQLGAGISRSRLPKTARVPCI